MSVILTAKIYFAQVHFQTFHLPSYRRNFRNLYQSFECRNDQVFFRIFPKYESKRYLENILLRTIRKQTSITFRRVWCFLYVRLKFYFVSTVKSGYYERINNEACIEPVHRNGKYARSNKSDKKSSRLCESKLLIDLQATLYAVRYLLLHLYRQVNRRRW